MVRNENRGLPRTSEVHKVGKNTHFYLRHIGKIDKVPFRFRSFQKRLSLPFQEGIVFLSLPQKFYAFISKRLAIEGFSVLR